MTYFWAALAAAVLIALIAVAAWAIRTAALIYGDEDVSVTGSETGIEDRT